MTLPAPEMPAQFMGNCITKVKILKTSQMTGDAFIRIHYAGDYPESKQVTSTYDQDERNQLWLILASVLL